MKFTIWQRFRGHMVIALVLVLAGLSGLTGGHFTPAEKIALARFWFTGVAIYLVVALFCSAIGQVVFERRVRARGGGFRIA